jgi:hypothetical protein
MESPRSLVEGATILDDFLVVMKILHYLFIKSGGV